MTMDDDPRRPIRRSLDAGARGPLSPGEVMNPAHAKPIPHRDQGESPRLYRGK